MLIKFHTELTSLPLQNATHHHHQTQSSAFWTNSTQLCKDHTKLDTHLLLKWDSLELQAADLWNLQNETHLWTVLGRCSYISFSPLLVSESIMNTPMYSVDTLQFPLLFQLLLTSTVYFIILFEIINPNHYVSLIFLSLLVVLFLLPLLVFILI